MANPTTQQFETPEYEEGHHDREIISESSGDSEMLYNNDDPDGICNIEPGDTIQNPNHIKQTPGTFVQKQHITSGNDFQPGSPNNGETTTTIGTEPNILAEAEEKEDSEQSYMNSIHTAITSLQKEIYKSDGERKQSEAIIEQQFAEIIEQMVNKKYEIVSNMHIFYDQQKEKSLIRIQELKNELTEKELEIQIKREKQLEEQQRIIIEQEEKAAAAKQQQENDREIEPLSRMQSLTIFGKKIAENASKAKSKASEYIEAWRSSREINIAPQAQYSKHDKIRLFVPKKDLAKLIEVDIKLSTEWWDPFKLNHIVYNTYDADLWRTSAIAGGWYNAFGSIKIRKSQSKRWNIRICERVKQQRGYGAKKKPADVVVGLIQSDKRKSQEKQGGFWLKPFYGFGFYGWNGKIFHKKSRGKVYGMPFYVGSVIGIELDMHLTPGMNLNGKSKPKTNVKSYGKTNIGSNGG
eukprot:906220_1